MPNETTPPSGPNDDSKGPIAPAPLRTPLPPQRIVEVLSALSKRGRLPGFSAPGRGGGLFTVDAFGTPFDRWMTAEARRDDGTTTLLWRVELKKRTPAIALLILIATVWPGLPLTDSLLKTYFGFYRAWTSGWLDTWMWYLPLTVPTLPLTWRSAMRRTNRTTREHAHATAAKIAEALAAPPSS